MTVLIIVAIAALQVAAVVIALLVVLPRLSRRARPDLIGDARSDAAVREHWITVAGVAGAIVAGLWSAGKDITQVMRAERQDAYKVFSEAVKTITESGRPGSRAMAIYSLGRIAMEHVEYRQQAIDLLRLYVLAHTPKSGPLGARAERIPTDVQAAISALGSVPKALEPGEGQLSLDRAYLVGASFTGQRSGFRGVLFTQASLLAVDFSGVDLSNADFRGSEFHDWVAFGWTGENPWTDEIATTRRWQDWEKFRFAAKFMGATLVRTDFRNTGLNGALFNRADLAYAQFGGANLSRADFRGARNIHLAKFVDSETGAPACADDPAHFDESVIVRLAKCSGAS